MNSQLRSNKGAAAKAPMADKGLVRYGSVVLLLAVACGSDASAKSVPARSSGAEVRAPARPLAGSRHAPAQGEEPDRRAHMEASFWMAIIARDALIDGDLAMARSVAHELAAHDYGDTFPPSWKHWVGEIQKRAGELAIAADEGEAGQAIAALALACGNCHHEQEGGFPLPPDEAMPWRDPPESMTERMDRHAVGIEQMWYGLIAPSDAEWEAGTITLTRAPLETPRNGEEPIDPKVHAEIERLRAIAKDARAARSYPERAKSYGAAITTCAHCHYTTTYIDP